MVGGKTDFGTFQRGGERGASATFPYRDGPHLETKKGSWSVNRGPLGKGPVEPR